MKKRCLSCAAAILTAAALTVSAAPVSVQAEAPMKIVALGDSITTGYSKDGTLIASYADMVSGYYGAELTNLAVDGLTSAGLLEQLSGTDVQEAVAGADVVLVTIGGNDILYPVLNNEYLDATQSSTMDELIANLKTENGSPNFAVLTPFNSYLSQTMPGVIAQFRTNVTAIAEQLKSATDAEIVFQTVYNPMDLDADDTALASSGSMEILSSHVKKFLEGVENNTAFPAGQCVNGAIRGLADVVVVDSYATLYDHGYYYTGINEVDVHPNNEGHLVIAESIIQALGIPETGTENGTKLRAVYTGSSAESTLAGVNAEYNESLLGRVLKNSYGDVDANGVVEIADAASTLSIYASEAAGVTPPVTGVNAQAADGNRDGKVGIDDASLMLSYYAASMAGIFDGTFTEYAAQNG